MTSHHNTTHLHGPDLREANIKASEQERKILRLFQGLKEGQGLGPSKVWRLAFQSTTPLTSVRRAITDRGLLVKTDERTKSYHGALEHIWVLAPADGQIGMFQRAA